MLLYAVAAEADIDPFGAAVLPGLRTRLEMFAGLDAATIGSMMTGDPDGDAAATAAASLPPYVVVPMLVGH